MSQRFHRSDTGRFGFVRRKELDHRRFVFVLNGNIRSRLETYDNSLSREKCESASKFKRDTMDMKRALVEQKILKKCMEMRQKSDVMCSENLYGKYGGVPIATIAKDVPRHMAKLDPKWKRLKEVEKLKEDGYLKGAILNDSSVSKRMGEFFSKCVSLEVPLQYDVRNELPNIRVNKKDKRHRLSGTRHGKLRNIQKSATTVKSYPGARYARKHSPTSSEISRQTTFDVIKNFE